MRPCLLPLFLTFALGCGGCATPALMKSLQERDSVAVSSPPVFVSEVLGARDLPQRLVVEVGYQGGATRFVSFTRNPSAKLSFADWPAIPYQRGAFILEPDGTAGRELSLQEGSEGAVWLEDGDLWRLDSGDRIHIGSVPAITSLRPPQQPTRHSTARKVALVALFPLALLVDAGIGAVVVGSILGLIGLVAVAKGC
jgi:hypothetical protein